jgi:5-bromo-4-chloroindolyl phosphate hydrolysis protein
MGLFAPDGSPKIDRLIEDTERAIANTRSFLEKIHESEDETRKYLETLTNSLENDLRRLERDRRERKEMELKSP